MGVGGWGDRDVDWFAIPTMCDEDDEVLAGMGLGPTSVARSLTGGGGGGGRLGSPSMARSVRREG